MPLTALLHFLLLIISGGLQRNSQEEDPAAAAWRELHWQRCSCFGLQGM